MTVSTTRPAASSRTCPMARRRAASGVTTNSRAEVRNSAPPGGTSASGAKRAGRRLVPKVGRNFRREGRLARRLARQILFEPMDMVVAIDDGWFPDQRPEQRQRGLNALDHHLV